MERIIKAKNFIADFAVYAATYILALFLILECNTAYSHVIGKYELLFTLQQSILFYAAIAVIALVIRGAYDIKKLLRDTAFLAIPALLLLVYYKISVSISPEAMDFRRAFFMFFPLIYIIFILDKNGGKTYRLLYALSDIVFFLALSSLIAWAYIQFFGGESRFDTISIAWGTGKDMINVSNLGFFWQKDWTFVKDGSLYRNIGIFREAPNYVMILCSSLATELFLKKPSPIIRTAVLSLTVLSTIGTMGVLILLGVWGLKILTCIKKNRKAYIFLGISAVILILITVLFLIRKRNMDPGSYNAHLSDYIACFKAWRDYPVFGCGWNREDRIGEYFDPPRLKYGIASTAALILAEGGLVLTLFFLLPFIVLWCVGWKKKHTGVAQWGLVIFVLYCVTIFLNRILITFLAFGYSFFSDLSPGRSGEKTLPEKTGVRVFCMDKGTVLYGLIISALTCFFMFSDFLAEHNMLLQQSQWSFVNMFAYGMWGVGLVRACIDYYGKAHQTDSNKNR